jgi:hypothetical protein
LPLDTNQIFSLQSQINTKRNRIKILTETINEVKVNDAKGVYAGHNMPGTPTVSVTTYLSTLDSEATTLLSDIATLRSQLAALGKEYVI